jgi:nitrite reductase/ring-hydroxylating ferredoxin subunit
MEKLSEQDDLLPVLESRREFLSKITVSGMALCAGSVGVMLSACEQSETPTLPISTGDPVTLLLSTAGLEDLATPGNGVLFDIPGKNNGNGVIIVRLSENSFTAFSSICTHEGNVMEPPNPDKANIYCPVHRAEFNSATGKIAAQPRTGSARDLTPFPVSYNATAQSITITF